MYKKLKQVLKIIEYEKALKVLLHTVGRSLHLE